MKLEGKRIGFVITGSFCTFKKTIEELKNKLRDLGMQESKVALQKQSLKTWQKVVCPLTKYSQKPTKNFVKITNPVCLLPRGWVF